MDFSGAPYRARASGRWLQRQRSRFGLRHQSPHGSFRHAHLPVGSCVLRPRALHQRVEQPGSLCDLSFLQSQPVSLHATEHLLYPPAQPIEAHNLLCCGELVGFSGNPQSGEQAPGDRSLPLSCVDLSYLQIGKRHSLEISLRSMPLPDYAYPSCLQPHPGYLSSIALSLALNANIHSAERAPI